MRGQRSFGLLLVALTGCAGLRLTAIEATQRKPSNVALYFDVKTSSGEPVAGLVAENFHVYEDGNLVSPLESKQTLLDPREAAARDIMLLVDLSGTITQSGDSEVIPQAISAFFVRVENQGKTAVYAFDGSPNLLPIVPFTDEARRVRSAARRVATFKPRDPSKNLNGAVIAALDELGAALARSSGSLKVGTLVVFTDGTDRASRVPTEEMQRRVRESPFDVYAIGLGSEIKAWELHDIGKNGTAMAADEGGIVRAFDDVGVMIASRTRSAYLLSYCSPARAGRHSVRIEATWDGGKAGHPQSGSFQSAFDASGFAPGCDSSALHGGDLASAEPAGSVESKRQEPGSERKTRDTRKAPKGPARPAGSSPSVAHTTTFPAAPAETAAPKPAQDFTP